jgi:hypothetical protein
LTKRNEKESRDDTRARQQELEMGANTTGSLAQLKDRESVHRSNAMMDQKSIKSHHRFMVPKFWPFSVWKYKKATVPCFFTPLFSSWTGRFLGLDNQFLMCFRDRVNVALPPGLLANTKKVSISEQSP